MDKSSGTGTAVTELTLPPLNLVGRVGGLLNHKTVRLARRMKGARVQSESDAAT
jgi:hypothetical protein